MRFAAATDFRVGALRGKELAVEGFAAFDREGPLAVAPLTDLALRQGAFGPNDPVGFVTSIEPLPSAFAILADGRVIGSAADEEELRANFRSRPDVYITSLVPERLTRALGLGAPDSFGTLGDRQFWAQVGLARGEQPGRGGKRSSEVRISLAGRDLRKD